MPSDRYRILRRVRPVGSGVSRSWWAEVSAVVKTDHPTDAPYCVANEIICSTLGRFLGLPIPPCGLLHDPGDPTRWFFGSLALSFAGERLPPVDPAACVTPALFDVSTGILVFDIWVANGDRHEANLTLDRSVRPPALSAFDHSHALFGPAPGEAVTRLARVRDELGIAESTDPTGNRHVLLDAVRSDECFPNWLNRVGQLPDFVIQDVCRAAYRAGLPDDVARAGVEFLVYRRTHLRAIITNHRSRFAVSDWSHLE